MGSLSRRDWALVLGLPALAYLPVLWGEFNFDDIATIVLNPQYGDWGAVWRAFTSAAGRGLFWLSLHLDYAAAGGPRPALFHATNLLLHLACTAGVALLARRLAGAPRAAAVASALLFGLHPLATGAACYVSQRSGVMAAAFTLASLLLLERRPAAAFSCWILAFLSKESAVTAPLSALALLPLLPSRKAASPWVWAGVLLSASVGIWGVFRAMGMTYYRSHWDLYAMAQPKVAWHYLRLWILPFHQTLDPDPGLSSGWLFPAALAALALAAWRLPAWPRAWVLVAGLALLPESSVVGTLPDLMFEYRMYLPAAALALAAAPALAGRPRLLAALLGLCLVLTCARALRWRSEDALWSEALRLAPRKLRVHANLSVRRRLARDPVSAERLIRRSLRIRKTPDQYRDLALVGLEGGMDAMGVEAARTALAMEPGRADCRAALGRLHLKAGRYSEAARELALAREKLPDDDGVLRDLSTALALSGNPAAASTLAQGLKGSDPETFLALGSALGSQGRLPEAAQCLIRYTTLRPSNPLGWANLAEVYRRLGEDARAGEARLRAIEACGTDPDYAGLRKALEAAP